MKIVVFNGAGDYVCRPDTTLNHDNSDYYCPEGVTSLRAVPCIYTHIDKAAKCVAERFADRYFSLFAFGCLLSDATGGTGGDVATSMDFTSVMDMAWISPEEPCRYLFCINGCEIFSLEGREQAPAFTTPLVEITKRTMLRIGDLIALELCPGAIVRPGDTISMTTATGSENIRIL